MPKESRRPGRAAKARERKQRRIKLQVDNQILELSSPANGWHHRIKLARAKDLLVQLEAEIGTWNAGKPYQELRTLDEEVNEVVVSVAITSEPSDQWRLLVGEYLHALRSALDLLVTELALAKQGPNLPEEAARWCEFPITKEPMKKSAHRKIESVDPLAQDLIRRVQPSRLGERYGTDPLWRLHELEKFDKHRRLLSLVVAQDGVGLGFPAEPGFALSHMTFSIQAQIEGVTEVARYANDGGYKLPLFLEFGLAFSPESPLPGHPVLPALREIRNHVLMKCVRPLERFLPAIAASSAGS